MSNIRMTGYHREQSYEFDTKSSAETLVFLLQFAAISMTHYLCCTVRFRTSAQLAQDIFSDFQDFGIFGEASEFVLCERKLGEGALQTHSCLPARKSPKFGHKARWQVVQKRIRDHHATVPGWTETGWYCWRDLSWENRVLMDMKSFHAFIQRICPLRRGKRRMSCSAWPTTARPATSRPYASILELSDTQKERRQVGGTWSRITISRIKLKGICQKIRECKNRYPRIRHGGSKLESSQSTESSFRVTMASLS